jgi:hypothetical protein
LTVTVPRRAAGSGFGATRNPTEPAPCPVVPEVIAIQEAALDADHVQSRFVSTAIVPLPPVAGADPIELVAATVHFDPVGAVTETDVDPQRAARSARTPTAHNSRARIAVEHGASALPGIENSRVLDHICGRHTAERRVDGIARKRQQNRRRRDLCDTRGPRGERTAIHRRPLFPYALPFVASSLG